MTRTFYNLKNIRDGLRERIGMLVISQPEKAGKIAELANRIEVEYSQNFMDYLPDNVASHDFERLKKSIKGAEKMFDDFDALNKLTGY
ncbi:MAG: hypothetical protein FWB73_00265 [Treponema sp.]|nr:hypothetical protein [Treponema sp.]